MILAKHEKVLTIFEKFKVVNGHSKKKNKKQAEKKIKFHVRQKLKFYKCSWQQPQSGKHLYVPISCVNKNQTAATSICMLSGSYSGRPLTVCASRTARSFVL